jgi:hypothetical protein
MRFWTLKGTRLKLVCAMQLAGVRLPVQFQRDPRIGNLSKKMEEKDMRQRMYSIIACFRDLEHDQPSRMSSACKSYEVTAQDDSKSTWSGLFCTSTRVQTTVALVSVRWLRELLFYDQALSKSVTKVDIPPRLNKANFVVGSVAEHAALKGPTQDPSRVRAVSGSLPRRSSQRSWFDV